MLGIHIVALLVCVMPNAMGAERMRRGLLLALVGLEGCDGWPDMRHESAATVTPGASAPSPPPLDPMRAALQDQVLALENESESPGAEPLPVLTGDEVVAVLGYYCGSCHAPSDAAGTESEGLNYINDLDRMTDNGKILPGNGEGSLLVRRMRQGEMPPSFSGDVAVPTALVDRIVTYIDDLAQQLPAAAPSPQTTDSRD